MDHYKVLSAYKIMWIFCFFDLPTKTKKEQKNASLFRNNLLKEGFSMMQYSVYIRNCASKEISETHINHIKKLVPAKGFVSFLSVTDKQYGDILNICVPKISIKKTPKQLEFF